MVFLDKEKTAPKDTQNKKTVNLNKPEKWISTTLLILAIAFFYKQAYIYIKRSAELTLELYRRIRNRIKKDVEELKEE